jgi:hypothetical protein
LFRCSGVFEFVCDVGLLLLVLFVGLCCILSSRPHECPSLRLKVAICWLLFWLFLLGRCDFFRVVGGNLLIPPDLPFGFLMSPDSLSIEVCCFCCCSFSSSSFLFPWIFLSFSSIPHECLSFQIKVAICWRLFWLFLLGWV